MYWFMHCCDNLLAINKIEWERLRWEIIQPRPFHFSHRKSEGYDQKLFQNCMAESPA